jgi:hypothetical protein
MNTKINYNRRHLSEGVNTQPANSATSLHHADESAVGVRLAKGRASRSRVVRRESVL